jgi:alpha-tubulin suppressor-like RCC1 family protein
MSLVDKATLVSKLTTIVNTTYETGSYVVDDVLSTALSMSLLSEINIITVDSVDLLPNLKYYNSPNAMIYYVNSIDVFAVSSNLKWLTLDGRLLRQDSLYGKIWSWGVATSGQLGDNTAIPKSSPVSVVGGFSDWCEISAGDYHSVGVRLNGTAWGWGRGTCGVIGDNASISRSSPVSVVGGFTDWCQVYAGYDHSLGLRSNGTAWAWGRNTVGAGSLGDNTTVDKSSPVSVVGGFTDWCQLSAGRCFSLGVRTNGSLWGWGINSRGQLGDNTLLAKSSPVSVVGGFTDWRQVSAGGFHTLAVRTNGTAWAWGCGGEGRLGDNATLDRSSPVSVVGGFTDWCQLSGGNNHSLGVRTNGSLWGWGLNASAQLGDNTTSNRSSPVSVVGGFTDWCQVSAGTSHSLAVRQNGTAWAWGCGNCGMLGDCTIVAKSSPVSVVGGFTNWCQVSASKCNGLGVISL